MASASEAAAAQAQRGLDADLRSSLQGPKLDLTIEELKERTRNIRDDQVIMLKRRIRTWTQEKIDPSKYSFLEFVGFNPEIIRNAFIAMGLYYKMNLDQLIGDIMMIIAMNLYMGNMLEKNRKRRSDQAKKTIAEMALKYGLKYGGTSTGLDPHVITVPRVAAAFPMLTVRMFHVLKANTLFGMPFMSTTVPYAMRTSVFCSFLNVKIPSSTRLFLMKVVACYSCDQSVIFSSDPKTRKPTLEAPDAFSRQWTYIQASANSPAEDLHVMHDVLVEFQIPDMYAIFKLLVENLDKLVGSNDPMPTEVEYRKDLSEFQIICAAERTRKEAEDTRIVAEARTARRQTPTGSAPPQVPPITPSRPSVSMPRRRPEQFVQQLPGQTGLPSFQAPTDDTDDVQMTPGTSVLPGHAETMGEEDEDRRGDDGSNEDLYD